MDIRLHLKVLWRWRRLVAVGVVVAVLLSILVTFKVGPGGFEWRSPATYESTSRTFVTQAGFPWGRTTLPGSDPTQQAVPQPDKPSRSFAPPARFTELATVYSYLAQSENVRRLIKPMPQEGQIQVATVPNPMTGDPLPLLQIITKSDSAAGARALNRDTIQALRIYLNENVRLNRVPADERVQLEVLNPPRFAVLTGGRSPTRSIIIALLVLVGTVVAVYVLENLYPSRLQAAASGQGEGPADPFQDLELDFEPDELWGPLGEIERPKPTA